MKSKSEKGGIHKVKLGKLEQPKGHHGKMHNKPEEKAHWKRPSKASTPREA